MNRFYKHLRFIVSVACALCACFAPETIAAAAPGASGQFVTLSVRGILVPYGLWQEINSVPSTNPERVAAALSPVHFKELFTRSATFPAGGFISIHRSVVVSRSNSGDTTTNLTNLAFHPAIGGTGTITVQITGGAAVISQGPGQTAFAEPNVTIDSKVTLHSGVAYADGNDMSLGSGDSYHQVLLITATAVSSHK